MMTKVTERNMGAVMGKINKFLSKPTKIYEGRKPVYIGTKLQDSTYVDIFRDEEIYTPFIGKCEEHWRRKEIRKKPVEDRITGEEYTMHHTLLAICDDYETNCIPIMAGFSVEITGDRMVIRQNDVVHKCLGLNGKMNVYPHRDKSEYIYFCHVDISEDELYNKQLSAMKNAFNMITDGYYCGGSFLDFYDSKYKADLALGVMREIEEMAEEMFCQSFNPDEVNLTVERVINDCEVELYCSPVAFKHGLPSITGIMYISVFGEKHYDIMDAVLAIVDSDDDDEDDDYEDDLW